MRTVSVNPLDQWPKVRRVKPGILQVKGRCITTGQWLLLRFIAALIAAMLLTSVLCAALLHWVGPLDAYFSDSSPVSIWIGLLLEFRWWFHHLLTEDYPSAGEALFYTGSHPVNWHLLAVWIALMRLRVPLRYTFAAALGKLLRPFLGHGFKVSFTRESVIIHRWGPSLKLQRYQPAGGEVAFRVSGLQYQGWLVRMLTHTGALREDPENELVMVMAVVGRRPVRITNPRKQIDAEKVVQSMELAMQHSRNLVEQ